MSEPSEAQTPPTSRTARFVMSAIFILLVGLIAFVAFRPAQQAEPGGGPPRKQAGRGGLLPVGAAIVKAGDIDVTLHTVGTVRPLNTAVIRPQVSGAIKEILFAEGAEVKAGDPLVEIDARPFEAQKLQAEGKLKADEAALANARAALSRYRAAAEAVTRQQVDEAAAAVALLEGTVLADKAAMAAANLQVSHCHIVAPFSGRVGLRQVDVGNLVSSGDAGGIVVLTQMNPISVLFTVPEGRLAELRAAVAKNAAPEVTIIETGAVGKLSAIDNRVDEATGTLKLRANFDNADASLLPSLFVNVRLRLATRKGVPLAPVSAVRVSDKNRGMYVVTTNGNGDSVVSLRTVTLGVSDDKSVEILSGVEAGECVVTEGMDNLREGAGVILPAAMRKKSERDKKSAPAAR